MDALYTVKEAIINKYEEKIIGKVTHDIDKKERMVKLAEIFKKEKYTGVPTSGGKMKIHPSSRFGVKIEFELDL